LQATIYSRVQNLKYICISNE